MLPEVNIDKAWGSALKDPVIETPKLIINADGTAAFNGILISRKGSEDYIKKGIDKLKAIAEDIEKTIAYYHMLGGQSMAANHLSFLKRDILDTAVSLEKAWPSK